MTLATIPESIPAMTTDGTMTNPDRPGFRVEILRSAGNQCGVSVNFVTAPWRRVLEQVKTEAVDGAFSASWSAERAQYGVFPLKGGVPDPARAMKGYSYILYLHPESKLSWNGRTVEGSNRKVIVERGAAGVDIAIKLGLEPLENTGYATMLRMLARRRAEGLIAIESHVNEILAANPELVAEVKAQQPPLESLYGYVMFNKGFYQANTALVECFWKALGDIRSKPAYRELVKSYNDGKFLE
ncbi:hypothetical protein GCM10025770_37610 [Viridibacterium curvum]|uniref:Solute-binding protein family 3/N-terminal domain-containing protein n=2 Tax=Viridibacterium curvum TaxID=1101404 RepID=A0ABP9R5X1_9RHOO